MTKVRRNEPCPCGSGKKFKRCCGSVTETLAKPDLPPEVWAAVDQKRREMEALEFQRKKQQGLGKPIISSAANGHRFVAVGNHICVERIERWKTFQDFLTHHLLVTLGVPWINREVKKPPVQQHKILQWLEQAQSHASQLGRNAKGIYEGAMSGAARAFLNLAYNIYLIAHNTTASESRVLRNYVKRLRSARSDEFVGVLFETYAAAAFLNAGFSLEFEDERDGTTSHVEFVATHPGTGKKFSVEVKARDPKSSPSFDDATDGDRLKRIRVASKLNDALRKKAKYTRVVFIELNIPDISEDMTGWPGEALRQIRESENADFPTGETKQSAYVIVTNHAFHNNLGQTRSGTQVLVAGFLMPDFGIDECHGYKAVLESRQRHIEILELISSLKTHYQIPSTFDGELPEFAFAVDDATRLKFGQWYEIPNEDGTLARGRLYEAIVVESEKRVYGAYELSTGEHVLVTCPLSDAELRAYRDHPETFFGEFRRGVAKPESFTDFCDFFYDVYRHTKRERLLEFLSSAPDHEKLKGLAQGDLAITFAERCAWQAYNRNHKKAS